MLLTTHLLTLVFIWTGLSARFVAPPCDQPTFDSNVQACLSAFNESMGTSGHRDGCPWPAAKGIYNTLKHCVDDWAKASWCRGRGFLVDEVFLEVHQIHFSSCGQVQDPPLTTLVMLVAPVVIATLFLPVLCFKLATWNTELPGNLGL